MRDGSDNCETCAFIIGVFQKKLRCGRKKFIRSICCSFFVSILSSRNEQFNYIIFQKFSNIHKAICWIRFLLQTVMKCPRKFYVFRGKPKIFISHQLNLYLVWKTLKKTLVVKITHFLGKKWKTWKIYCHIPNQIRKSQNCEIFLLKVKQFIP